MCLVTVSTIFSSHLTTDAVDTRNVEKCVKDFSTYISISVSRYSVLKFQHRVKSREPTFNLFSYQEVHATMKLKIAEDSSSVHLCSLMLCSFYWYS